ncbi:hypothetical protein HNQ74_000958 [Bartonella doshiae]|uniref:hypothetical protein n=1 Tax=Bartonella doshiae TaxID=33044 RepID=UPI0002ECC737|nr:hypothetical protein [Bartonella doshiae]MBB6159528.1 hypothetical protein [Bartonella doshiae]
MILTQDPLLTSEKNLQWQKIFNDLLVSGYMNGKKRKNKKANLDISFQKDIIDFTDIDAVEQRIESINYYLSDCLLKDDFDYCYIRRCSTPSHFNDFYFGAKADGSCFLLHKASEKYCNIFYSKVVKRSYV